MTMTTKQKQVIGIGALLSFAILALGYVLIVKPVKAKVTDIQASTASQVSANTQLQQQITQLQSQQAGLVGKQVELHTISQRIPSNPDTPGLIRSLTQLASQTGVVLASETFGTPTGATAAAPTTGRPSGATATGTTEATGTSVVSSAPAAYQTIPITLTVQGTYTQMVMFMDKLENLQRLYLVKGLTLAPLKEGVTGTSVTYGPDGTAQQTGDLTASVTGEVYDTSADTTSIDLPALSGAAGASTTSTAGTTTPTTATTSH